MKYFNFKNFTIKVMTDLDYKLPDPISIKVNNDDQISKYVIKPSDSYLELIETNLKGFACIIKTHIETYEYDKNRNIKVDIIKIDPEFNMIQFAVIES